LGLKCEGSATNRNPIPGRQLNQSAFQEPTTREIQNLGADTNQRRSMRLRFVFFYVFPYHARSCPVEDLFVFFISSIFFFGFYNG
jgi:hypothetical protein